MNAIMLNDDRTAYSSRRVNSQTRREHPAFPVEPTQTTAIPRFGNFSLLEAEAAAIGRQLKHVVEVRRFVVRCGTKSCVDPTETHDSSFYFSGFRTLPNHCDQQVLERIDVRAEPTTPAFRPFARAPRNKNCQAWTSQADGTPL